MLAIIHQLTFYDMIFRDKSISDVLNISELHKEIFGAFLLSQLKKSGSGSQQNHAKSYSELRNILQYDSNKNGCTSQLKLCQKLFRARGLIL